MMIFHSYEQVRELYSLKARMQNQSGILTVVIPDDIKRAMRAFYHREKPAKNTVDGWKVRYSDDGEGAVFYALFTDGNEYADDEIESYCDSLERHSAWDCGGSWCTSSMHWKRVAAGVVIIHHMVLNV